MPKKNPRDSKKLKQTTLLDGPIASTLVRHNTRSSRSHSSPMKSSSPLKGKTRATTPDTSSDDIGDIRFAPAKKATQQVSDDDDCGSSPSKLTRKRRIIRIPSEKPTYEGKDLGKASSPVTVDDDESEEDLAPRKKRRLIRRQSSGERTEIIDEDSDDLADEVDEERILDSRFRKRNKRSTFQENLEKLKRRKLKISVPEDNDGEEEEEEEEDDSIKLFKGARKTSQLEGSDDEDSCSSHSSGFIVEDDSVVQLPAEFSMETHQDLSHQFKKIFQFFVHIAVQPPESRASFMKTQIADTEYFSIPLKVTRRKISGLRDSLVASSVWKPEYKRSLEKYPEFSLVALEFAVPYCDACHLGGRKSTLIGRAHGLPYDRSGFEPLLAVTKEVDSEEEETAEFHLGRFCARRTRVYHLFSHWENALFQSVSKEIDELRKTSSSKGYHRVAFFRGQEPPSNLADADALCDWLDQRKIIEHEWQNLKTMMESARHLELQGKGGDQED